MLRKINRVWHSFILYALRPAHRDTDRYLNAAFNYYAASECDKTVWRRLPGYHLSEELFVRDEEG